MNKEEKRQIVAAFSEECQTDQKQIKEDNDFLTYNSSPMMSWDLRFKRINKVACSLGFEVIRVPRSKLWEFIAVFSQGELYLFFKDKNLKHVLRKYEDNPYHYILCAIGVINERFNGKSETEQLELFEDEYKQTRNEINEKLFGEYYSKIKEVRIFTIEELNGKAIRAEELLLDSKGNYVEATDYSDAISADYSSILNQEVVKKESLVQLKPGIKKNNIPVIDLKPKTEILKNSN